jgi:hypothetical protein
MAPDLGGKRLELVKDLLPEARRVAVLWNAANPYSALAFKETEHAARTLEIEIQSLEVRAPADFDGAPDAAARQHADALITVEDPLTMDQRKKIAEFGMTERLPTIAGLSLFSDADGLMSYGANVSDTFRRSVGYVGKILKGDEAVRPASRATHPVRAGHQPQNCQSARPVYSFHLARSRRRGHRVRRRDFIAAFYCSALGLPSSAAAQQPGKVWRTGHMLTAPAERGLPFAQALERSLADLGYVQGRNIVLLHRFEGADGQDRRGGHLLIAANRSLGRLGKAGFAAEKLAGGVPTVFISIGFPVELGLVQSLSHRGGNMTGIAAEAAWRSTERDCRF